MGNVYTVFCWYVYDILTVSLNHWAIIVSMKYLQCFVYYFQRGESLKMAEEELDLDFDKLDIGSAR